ncbi:hypothetical protein [Streptomyces sp. NPDC087300]|uniref:hypothetical protein n=1 Tax=Streptomyces sp. NPDC087300 TaxID=3365780 RepID=UPI0038246889
MSEFPSGLPRTVFETWTSPEGIACAMGAGARTVNGYVQLPDLPPGFPLGLLTPPRALTYRENDLPQAGSWVGFDTGHADDRWNPKDLESAITRIPDPTVRGRVHEQFVRVRDRGHFEMQASGEGVREWTVPSVREETERLAAELAEIIRDSQ